MHDTEYLSRPQAAEYLGLSAQTLANNRHTGPTYHKFFGKVMYSKADLDNWARQQRVIPMRAHRQTGNVHRLRSVKAR